VRFLWNWAEKLEQMTIRLGLCARIHNMRAFIRHPSDIPIEIFPEQQVTHATQRLTNVSIGGLCYRSDTFFEIGLLVKVRISLIKPPFEAKSRVVWCLKRGTGFDVGLQFIETRDIYKVRLVEQICHIEHYKKKVFREEGRVLNGEEAALEWLSKYDCEFTRS
jgi:hypothetical protein